MKKSILLVLLILGVSPLLLAQVGIGTTDPQETLHVVGTMRADNTTQATVTTTELMGIDGDGTLREVTVGSNLDLTDNTLNRKNSFDESFGSITLSVTSVDDLDLLLDSGETNEGKSIIRIFQTGGLDLDITGIKDGYDGQHIWLYAQSKKIFLRANDTSSLAGNRIEDNTRLGCGAYEMIELLYDGTLNKWVVLYHHG